jgi:hypothetical protein
MKGKLIKIVDGYELFTQGFLKSSTNHGLIDSLNIEEGPIRYKLSLKNCQAIERGYDLNEIKRKLFGGFDGLPDSFTIAAVERTVEIMFEILSDKKFSENDMQKALSAGLSIGYGRQFEIENKQIEINSYMKSLQQTEWDVEIEMWFHGTRHKKGKWIPKLDADGCLILKKK